MKRYLVLENGEVFAGLAFGAPCDTVGELVFTTGMNGYIETLTDPSYCGQIVLQTFPLIGNYGIIPADFEGKCCVRGYVVREQCQTPSNFRCEETLDAFLKANNIPGIAVDGNDPLAVYEAASEAVSRARAGKGPTLLECKTYRQHVIEAKMTVAKQMLNDTRMRVEDVAYAVGYENYISFYNVFKRIEHMSPSEYRFQKWNGEQL